MKKYYVVYKVTNKINGKIYVGKTYNLEKRKREHIHDINNELPFHRALKKYGIENFLWEIVDSTYNDEEIKEKEIFYIKKFNSCIHFKNSNGYNITIGGEGGVSWNSKPIVQFDMNGRYIDEFISASCASNMLGFDRKSIIRAANKKYSSSNGYQWRYKEEWDGKNIEKFVKSESVLRKRIVQLDKDGYMINIFESISKASRILKIERSTISACLIGNVRTAGNYQWIYESDYNPSKDYSHNGIKYGNGVVQLDEQGNLIARYNNCAEAARSLNLETKCHKTIHGKLDTTMKAYGFYWKKYDNYIKLQQGNTEVIA